MEKRSKTEGYSPDTMTHLLCDVHSNLHRQIYGLYFCRGNLGEGNDGDAFFMLTRSFEKSKLELRKCTWSG